MFLVEGNDTEEYSVRVHGKIVRVNVIVMEDLSKETRKGKPKSSLYDGSYWDRYFGGKGVVGFFLEGWNPKIDITGNSVFFSKGSNIVIPNEEMSELMGVLATGHIKGRDSR